MNYGKWITTGTTNDADNPLLTRIQCSHGVIVEWNVYFPPGSAGTLEVKAMDALHQVMPATNDEVLKGDGVLYDFPDYYPLAVEPYEIQVETANTDGTNDRTVWIGTIVLPLEAAQPTEKLADKLGKLLARMGV